FYTPSDLGFEVARGWSNAAAAAGHNPCAPSSATYFNSAPVLPDTVGYTDSGSSAVSKGINIPVGSTGTLLVDLFSDAPTAPWTVSAFEETGSNLSFTWDKTT